MICGDGQDGAPQRPRCRILVDLLPFAPLAVYDRRIELVEVEEMCAYRAAHVGCRGGIERSSALPVTACSEVCMRYYHEGYIAKLT